MEPPHTRWWPIAKMTMRLAVKKKGFWVWSILSAWVYILLIAVYYFIDSATQSAAIKSPLASVIWKNNFVSAYSAAQLFLFILTLLICVGQIANDNQANALLVYLSRPCDRFDYLFGKWLGVFAVLFAVAFVPSLVFWLYGALSYGQYHFLTQDKLLVFKLIPLAMLPAAFHASFGLGISALTKQGRIAGAVYAAIYFIGLAFTLAAGGIYLSETGGFAGGPGLFQSQSSPPETPVLHTLRNLYFCSVDGILIGSGKDLLGTNGAALLPGRNRQEIARPDAIWMVLGYLGLCSLGLGLAWSKIRAVEVV